MRKISSALVFLFLSATAFSQGINSLNAEKVRELAGLCKVWGYLKYYHPTIQQGKIDWDTTLVLTIPQVYAAKTNNGYNKIITQLILEPGRVKKLSRPYKYLPKDTSFNTFDFSWIKNDTLFSEENRALLAEVIENYRPGDNVYIKREVNKYYVDRSAKYYFFGQAPDSTHALLALFRYWNEINYFFAYKNYMDENWDSVLVEFIPRVIESANTQKFYATVAEVVAKINDCHAFYENYNFSQHIGAFKSAALNAPLFIVNYIDNKTVITDLSVALAAKTNLMPGDIVLKVNGTSIDSIRSELRKYCGCSTPFSVEREINNAIFRSHFARDSADLVITVCDSTGSIRNVIYRVPVHSAYHSFNPLSDSTVCLLPNSIGYMNLSLESDKKDFQQNMKRLQHTKALIFDMRGGIEDDILPYLIALRLPHRKKAAFANYYTPNTRYPGVFKLYKRPLTTEALELGVLRFFHKKYKGKVVFLINENDQSSNEFAVMFLKAQFNITLIGRNTSGTDGVVTSFLVQNNILTYFSSDAVFYPDGKPTQRVGIKPDIYVSQTIKGIRARRDEVLERAIEFINTGK